MQPTAHFWQGKRVLLSGHTGFKGTWLMWWLNRLGAEVTGFALSPQTKPSLFELLRGDQLCDSNLIDICNQEAVEDLVLKSKPDIVLHLAAQALVRTAYEEPVSTFQTNVLGTVNLLEAIRTKYAPKVVVAITTDKVYHNREWLHPYRECDSLGGYDPYSASKAACEMAISSYVDSYLGARALPWPRQELETSLAVVIGLPTV